MVLNLIQIGLGIFLIIVIILQAKGTGLGSALGGSSYHTKRGAEKTLFAATIISAVLFVLTAFANSILK